MKKAPEFKEGMKCACCGKRKAQKDCYLETVDYATGKIDHSTRVYICDKCAKEQVDNISEI